ncbi:MAG: efflux transporter periplasmic adaptor subunit [Cycloclasticus sp. symbiont of Bathymodiolus heckerae]|nr:MAG: efflux transporter periplasmic adaptor subunit [Cycloclasticus sp. symbiont of Bathymodiolus heckerae]
MGKKIGLLLLLILLVFGGLFGSKFLQIKSAMSSRKAPPPPLVTTTQTVQEEWATHLSAVGNINPVLGVVLSNEVAGIVTKLHFVSGQPVTKGDLLLELNTATDRAILKGLIASEKLALIKLKRQVKLLKSKATSRSSHDEARAELDIAKAAVAAQQSTLDKKLLRAPFDGEIGIRQVSLGQYIDKGYQIAPLVSFESTIVDFTLPERNFADLRVNQDVLIKVQAYQDDVFKGHIQAINPGLHQDTRTIAVRAIMDNPDMKLRAGMFANISIILSKPLPVLSLLETAISYNTYGENVFIVLKRDDKTVVEQRAIKTGVRRNGRIEILHGLSLGDTVVNEGHVKLRNGIEISVAEKPTPG